MSWSKIAYGVNKVNYFYTVVACYILTCPYQMALFQLKLLIKKMILFFESVFLFVWWKYCLLSIIRWWCFTAYSLTRVHYYVNNLNNRTECLTATAKLLKQDYWYLLLCITLSKFYRSYSNLIEKKYTTLTDFFTKYFMMCKVYNGVGGIKKLYHVWPPIRKIILSLKLVDYLYVQAGNP